MTNTDPIPPDKKREIIQLWYVAENYFDSAMQVKDGKDEKVGNNPLVDKWMNETSIGIAGKCKCLPAIDGDKNLKAWVLMSADLGSCAARLTSIDELLYAGKEKGGLGLKGSGSRRRGKYCELYRNKKGDINHQKLENSLDDIIHQLLRHNIAHTEPLSPPDNKVIKKNLVGSCGLSKNDSQEKKEFAKEVMRKFIDKLTLKQMYESMQKLIESMQNDPYIKPVIESTNCAS